MSRKGSCTNHMRDVAALLHGHHLTVHARDEDEVDEQAILEKLERAGSSAYNFRQRSTETSPQSKPVVSSWHKQERRNLWNFTELRLKKKNSDLIFCGDSTTLCRFFSGHQLPPHCAHG